MPSFQTQPDFPRLRQLAKMRRSCRLLLLLLLLLPPLTPRMYCSEKEWMTMRMLQSDIIMEATKAISDVIVSLFLKNKDFNFELWDMFFQLSGYHIDC